MSITKDRRIGIFIIGLEMIDDDPDGCISVLNGCIVVRAETLYHMNAIEYVAYHESFKPVRVGVEVPKYMAVITSCYDAEAQTIKKDFAGFSPMEN